MPSEDTQGTALLDIAENIRFAQSMVRDMDYETFRDDKIIFCAATRCLEIISEASRRLTPELKKRHAHIDWRKAAAAGNIYRHNYEDVQQQLVWSTIHNRLPELLIVAEAELTRS